MTDIRRIMIAVYEPDADAERHAELTRYLLRELAEVSDARFSDDDTVPEPGARGAGAIEMTAALAVVLEHTAALAPHVANVVRVVRSWLSRSSEPMRTVSIKYDDLELELTPTDADEQRRLVDAFLAAMARKLDAEER